MKVERGAIRKKLRLEQNLIAGLIAGTVAGVIGALLWCVITVTLEFQIGYMAVAIGAGVGFAVRYFGKGVDPIFGIGGAVIAIVSCILGNYFSMLGFIAHMSGVNYSDTIANLRLDIVFELMKENFGLVDLIFYAIAAFEGYKFSFRNIDAEIPDKEEV